MKTNVVFLARGSSDKASTTGVWVYDMRASMDSFGKTRSLSLADFAAFEAAFGTDPYGKSPRRDEGELGRFRHVTRQQIAERGDNLDIAWLRDTSADPEGELREAEEMATVIASHLRTALEEVEAYSEELGGHMMAGYIQHRRELCRKRFSGAIRF